MMSQVLSHFHLPWLTCIALLIFFTFFVSMLFWVFRKNGKPVYQYIENLPLEIRHDGRK